MLLFFHNKLSDWQVSCRSSIVMQATNQKIISFHFPRFSPGSHPLTKIPEYLS